MVVARHKEPVYHPDSLAVRRAGGCHLTPVQRWSRSGSQPAVFPSSPYPCLGLVCTPYLPCWFSDHICHFSGLQECSELRAACSLGWTEWVDLKLPLLTLVLSLSWERALLPVRDQSRRCCLQAACSLLLVARPQTSANPVLTLLSPCLFCFSLLYLSIVMMS